MDSDLLEISEDEFSSTKLQYSNLTPFYCSASRQILLLKLQQLILSKSILNSPEKLLSNETGFLNLFQTLVLKLCMDFEFKFSCTMQLFLEVNRQAIMSIYDGFKRKAFYELKYQNSNETLQQNDFLNNHSKRNIGAPLSFKSHYIIKTIEIDQQQLLKSLPYVSIQNNHQFERTQILNTNNSAQRFLGKYIHDKPIIQIDQLLFKDMQMMIQDKSRVLKVGDYCLIKYVLRWLVLNLGYQFLIPQLMANFFNKDPCVFAQIWISLIKENKIIQKKKNDSKFKIYPYKYVKYFCNICRTYACSYHFQESETKPLITNDFYQDDDDINISYYDDSTKESEFNMKQFKPFRALIQ